jgi:hypothetical protein
MIDGEGKRLKAGAELPDDLILIVIVICTYAYIYMFYVLVLQIVIVIFYVSINSIYVHTFVIE